MRLIFRINLFRRAVFIEVCTLYCFSEYCQELLKITKASKYLLFPTYFKRLSFSITMSFIDSSSFIVECLEIKTFLRPLKLDLKLVVMVVIFVL